VIVEKKCSYLKQKLEHLLVVSNLGSIDTGDIVHSIKSMQFINPTGSQELLIISGSESLGVQIYEMKGSNQSPIFELRQSLKHEEDSGYNYFLVKGNYFFTMQ
jgi:hypothetical protein